MNKFFVLTFWLLMCGLAAHCQFAKVNIGLKSTGSPEMMLKLVARIQSNNQRTGNVFDHFDRAINSPKSALILEKTVNGKNIKKLYINNLEGFTTSVYDMNDSLRKIAVIKHHFTLRDSTLFKETDFPGYPFNQKKAHPNVFIGKPVEMCPSNNGRYLWVPYYRRSFDTLSTQPSAIALIDADRDKIIRVFPSAPLPKMIACSPDNKYIAVTNWGDNTVHLIDISSGDPFKFHYIAHFVVDHRLKLVFSDSTHRGHLRDHQCGLCLRGTVFSPDSNYLFVGRMGGGGIAVFDLKAKKYLGSVFGTKRNVRHLVINGNSLFLSSSQDGYVEKADWKDMLSFFKANPANGKSDYKKWQNAFTGFGARTITVTSDGAYLFANANKESKITIVRTSDMKIIGSVKADPFPVGMAIDKSNKFLVVTAQGRYETGGNSVMVYEIRRR
jgi:DNA-binding beta-propeller fold protein YncE